MQSVLNQGDTMARVGGDEFLVILTDLHKEGECKPILDKLLKKASSAVIIDGLILRVSVSIGVSISVPDKSIDSDHLIRQADQAMYQAKQLGKNRYYVFDLDKDSAINTQRENLVHIKRALRDDEFVLYYQPKVNMLTGDILGVEALIRWEHPQKGLLSPVQFLPIIDNHTMSIELGEWVIAAALIQIENWAEQGLRMPVSINISALHLQQNSFVSRLKTFLESHATVDPSLLELEVLETGAIGDIVQVSEIMEKCAELGVTFALDDFGTGYSSMTYLRRLPADVIKIDQVFVSDMLVDPDDLAIVEGVIGLAKAFGRQVIAEGVETVEQGKALLQIGCELAQGYVIVRPMKAEVDHQHWITALQAYLNGEKKYTASYG